MFVISLFVPDFHSSTQKFVELFGYSFAFDAPTVWNALPEEIRVSPSLPLPERILVPTFTPRQSL